MAGTGGERVRPFPWLTIGFVVLAVAFTIAGLCLVEYALLLAVGYGLSSSHDLGLLLRLTIPLGGAALLCLALAVLVLRQLFRSRRVPT